LDASTRETRIQGTRHDAPGSSRAIGYALSEMRDALGIL